VASQFNDLFKFRETFQASKKQYTLEFELPPVDALWSLFDADTTPDINCDQSLLSSFDTLFNEGRFITLFDWNGYGDVGEDINDAYQAFLDKQTASSLLGEWTYLREGRAISLEWQVPSWFLENSDHKICDMDEIRNTLKDWYVYSPE